MGRKSKYFKEIERLLDIGYDAKHIVKVTGIPQSTVYRLIDKIRIEYKRDFNHLLDKDYVYKYMSTIENFDKSIIQCNEEVTKMNAKYITIENRITEELASLPIEKAMVRSSLLNSLVQIQSSRTNEMVKLMGQRDKSSDLKAKTYNQGPVVFALDEWVRKNTPSMGELPKIQELVEDETPKLNKTETNTSEEDEAVLREMEDGNEGF